MGLPDLLQQLYTKVLGLLPRFGGSATPSSSFVSKRRLRGLENDADVDEIPFRNSQFARQLQCFVDECPEVGTALDIIGDYVFSSQAGDELGFAIVEDADNPQPETVAIARALQKRIMSGVYLQPVPSRGLAWGDCFGNLAINWELRQIDGLEFLPTWQTFRVEASDLPEYREAIARGEISSNQLIRFEQWKGFRDRAPLMLHPITVVHWRWKRKYKYGRSHFAESILGGDAEHLEQSINDLVTASHAIGYNPNVHTMPDGYDDSYKKAYKADYQAQLRDGVITDIFLLSGATVNKASAQWNPFMSNLKDNINLWRTRIAMRSRIPPWLLGGELRGIRDLGGQPALSFSVFIGSVRMFVADGIKQIINTELALKGVPPERWAYVLKFPTIYTNPFQEQDADEEGITDLDG